MVLTGDAHDSCTYKGSVIFFFNEWRSALPKYSLNCHQMQLFVGRCLVESCDFEIGKHMGLLMSFKNRQLLYFSLTC